MLCAWSQCTGCNSPVRAGDPTAARQWVSRFVGDDPGMARLRLLAISIGAEASPARADDQALLDQIAAGIAAGSVRVCGAASTLRLYGLVASPARASAAPAPAAPPRAVSAVAAAAETTFGPDLAVAAMVAVLVQAAQQGVPFCEECVKAAAKRAAAQAGA